MSDPAGVVSPYRALDTNQGQKISRGYKNKSVHEGLGRVVTTKTTSPVRHVALGERIYSRFIIMALVL